jgi:hypothetical protein
MGISRFAILELAASLRYVWVPLENPDVSHYLYDDPILNLKKLYCTSSSYSFSLSSLHVRESSFAGWKR